MCAEPGRSFNKSKRAAPLFDLLPVSQISKDVANLFVDATTMTASFAGARTDESMAALRKLCEIKSPVVDNLLHNISSLPDTQHKISFVDATGATAVVSSEQSTAVSFAAQREMARAELKRRGMPKYNPGHYAMPATPALRLCDPVHPGRKELDWVAMIVDQSIQVEMAGDRAAMVVTASADQLERALAKLDHAIARCPSDPDLLVAKACLLEASGRSAADIGPILEAALIQAPGHFEALNWNQHSETWTGAFRFPRWDKKSSVLQPVMAAHLSLDHRIQVVRNGLQKTLALVTQVQGPPFDTRTEVAIKWVLSQTPYGPLIAYYLKLTEPSDEPSIMEGFLPGFQPDLFAPSEGYFLIQQLAFTPYLFVVLVNGNKVTLNRRIIFDGRAAGEIREIAASLSAATSYLPQSHFQQAMQWHMNNFDAGNLKFLS
jgi:hypothetical protein